MEINIFEKLIQKVPPISASLLLLDQSLLKTGLGKKIGIA